MATIDDSTIALYCEMRAFIRPDSSLIWEGPVGRRITDGTDRHQITFSDGAPNAAANGGGVLVPSRVSILTITNPEPSDTGTYTCSVMGTSEVVNIELMVNGTEIIDTTDISTTDVRATNINTTESDANTTDVPQTTSTTCFSDNGTLQLAVIILGSMTAILAVTTAVAICCLLHARNKSTKLNIGARSNLVYDYITVPGLDHNVQPDESITASKIDDTMTDTDEDKSDLTVERNYDEINDDLNTSTYEMITDNLPDQEINVELGVTVDSEMNAACGLTTDGISNSEKSATYGVHTDDTDATTVVNMIYDHLTTDADMTDKNETEADCVATDGMDTMERNTAYDVANTIMDSNEAYGAAIDGIGIDTMERNIAYGAVLSQDDSSGDSDAI